MFARATIRSIAVTAAVVTALGLGVPLDAQAAEELTIGQIQGPGGESEFVGQEVITTGVVTAQYPTGGYDGFVIQTPGSGGDGWLDKPGPSAGIFVHAPSAVGSVSIGEAVLVDGVVREEGGLTVIQVDEEGQVKVIGAGDPVNPVPVDGPLALQARESVESMLVRPTGAWTVSGTDRVDRTGELDLAAGDAPLRVPSDVAVPGTEDIDKVAAENAARGVVLSDGAVTDYLDPKAEVDPPYLSLADPVRVGAPVEFTQPVISGVWDDRWTFDPIRPVVAKDPRTAPARFANTRVDAPSEEAIGKADVRVAAFDVSDYFVSLGIDNGACQPVRDRDGNGVTVAVTDNPDCLVRGAWDDDDLQRQEAKLLAAITGLKADVVGLTGIENSVRVSGEPDRAVARLVERLNGAEPGWAYVRSPKPTTDRDELGLTGPAIIYRTDRVKATAEPVVLGEQDDPDRVFRSAPPLGQQFTPGTGSPFLFVAVEFASRTAQASMPGDEDSGDGQGLSTATRMAQANAIRDWTRTLTDGAVVVAGDFQSYSMEYPMITLADAGFTDVVAAAGTGQFTDAADGVAGSTVHVMVNADGRARMTGASVWPINAPESPALGYGQFDMHPGTFFELGRYRSSSHNPVLVGLIGGPGAQPLTSILADITRAYPNGTLDLYQESTLGNFVAGWMAAALSGEEQGAAMFGAVEPSGITGDLPYGPDGVVNDVQAAGVLGSNDPLWVVGVSGAQVLALLNQQWRADGSVALLGLSSNLTYTYDLSRPIGDRVTSVTLDDTPLDPGQVYRFATTSALVQGADGFSVTQAPDSARQSALPARDAFVSYLGAGFGFEAGFARRGVQVSPLPTIVPVGGSLSLSVADLDLTSLGVPSNTRLSFEVDRVRMALAPVSQGSATVSGTLPLWVEPGPHTLTMRARPSGTLVTVPITVVAD